MTLFELADQRRNIKIDLVMEEDGSFLMQAMRLTYKTMQDVKDTIGY